MAFLAALPEVLGAGAAAEGGAAAGGGGSLLSRFGLGALKQGATSKVMGGGHQAPAQSGQPSMMSEHAANSRNDAQSGFSGLLQTGQFH